MDGTGPLQLAHPTGLFTVDSHVLRVGDALPGFGPLRALGVRVSAADHPTLAETTGAPAEDAHVGPVGRALAVCRPAGTGAAPVLTGCGEKRVRSADAECGSVVCWHRLNEVGELYARPYAGNKYT